MSAVILRIVVLLVLAAMIYFGVARILRDWRARFRDLDNQARERDLRERQRPDVIDLERGNDGVFRPGDDDRK